MNRKKTQFWDSAVLNNSTYMQYVDRLTELSCAMFKWDNLPDTVNVRYLELELFLNGSAVFFIDPVIGLLALSCLPGGQLDVYGNPIERRAYSRYSSYNIDLKQSDSVIVWNNYLRKNSVNDVQMFAMRLYNLDRIIDVNANAQKTPVLVQGSEKQRLTLLNLYKEYDGNQPFIFGDKNLDLNALKAINTQAPYIADKIYELKTQIWNEALTYLGIVNVSYQKKERMVTDEVLRNQGGTLANRLSRLNERQRAAEQINKMFGTDIKVSFNDGVLNGELEVIEGGEEDE